MVRGTLKQVWSPRSFVLEGHDWIFPDDLLVFAPRQRAAGDVG
jgi:hypothetical protein